MLDKIRAKLEEKYYPSDLIDALRKAKTDEELLSIARSIVAQVNAVERLNYEIMEVMYGEKKAD